MKPKRITLSRKKGYRKPRGAVVVSRPSRFGNPYSMRDGWTQEQCVTLFRKTLLAAMTRNKTDECWYSSPFAWMADHLHELRGKDLACWCKDEPCYADVLLHLSNL